MYRRIILAIPFITLLLFPSRILGAEGKQLFNGKDMTGWEHVGPGGFTLENGMLKSEGGMGLLWYTPEKMGNIKIRVVYKLMQKDTNSGVYVRIPEKPTEPWMPVNKGNEVQIYNPGDDYHCTGVIYSFSKALARPYKPVGEWDTMEITLDGPRTIVYLNGVKTTDYVQGQPDPPNRHEGDPASGVRPNIGYIGLQNHNQESVVYFREVEVKPLH
ncbi:MAG TPA: DUF1080 domain-containing protein [Terriglobia bacterium]|nr:DUF1080 domain-containing protein [Terriglobia bacterium]